MKNSLLTLAIVALALGACSDNDDDVSTNQTADLKLDIQGLDDLGPDYAYEGWVMVDGVPVTTGTFNVNANGDLSTTDFEVSQDDLDAATAFILTIEPSPDNDPAPSDVKYLAGSFDGDTVTLSTDFGPAPGDFSDAAGSFFLRTPTDELNGNNGNDEAGVWFGSPGMPPTANLDLPELPEGWVYEGWVIGDSGPLSTGTFTDFGDRDDDNGFSGTENNAGPPVPGEDFFNNLPNGESLPFSVVGRNVVISLEPVPDNSPAPFTLKPLFATAGAATAPASQNFQNYVQQSFPRGTVRR
ncbi:anti-sigma factor [Nonlabens ponticola]|uniref:Anti-sigma factor n=1 Tax=Nonlabens ponticola TaxID=2496866 RepID=A0A3S9MW27_9FLAO|nr:anti-sigma factor [Nonlabens ponticola]AZQ43339.1 anti-sigma factor [Nonlabens ponticola]